MIAAGWSDGAMKKNTIDDFLPAALVLSRVKTTRQLVKQMPRQIINIFSTAARLTSDQLKAHSSDE